MPVITRVEECIGCFECVMACPVLAITLSDHDCPTINREECLNCGECIEVCPMKIIVSE